MITNNETTVAAERVRRYRDGENIITIYGTMYRGEALHALDKDRDTIVDAYADLTRELVEARAELPCGHPKSLEVKSVESDYRYCELCETKDRLRDALTMEHELRAKVDKLEAALVVEEASHSGTIDQRDAHEQSLNDLFFALDMNEVESEWSSGESPVTRALERAASLLTMEQQFADLKAQAAAFDDAMLVDEAWLMTFAKPIYLCIQSITPDRFEVDAYRDDFGGEAKIVISRRVAGWHLEIQNDNGDSVYLGCCERTRGQLLHLLTALALATPGKSQ